MIFGKLARTKFILITFVLCLLFLLNPSKVSADTPTPNVKVACGQSTYVGIPGVSQIALYGDEYHSLRPYQANDECTSYMSDYASYCGSDLTLKDTVEVKFPGSENYLDGSVDIGDGSCSCSFSQGNGCFVTQNNCANGSTPQCSTYPNVCKAGGAGSCTCFTSKPACITRNDMTYCSYKVPVSKTVTIDVSGAELPIMGNTGDQKEVTNSQNKLSSDEETLTDADKVNNYVSWYLNGTVNRAEYMVVTNEDWDKLINYSGPINKLLPQDIQFINRSASVKRAVNKQSHDQLVGCSLQISTPSVLGFVGEIFNKGKINVLDVPIPCYSTGVLNVLETVTNVKKKHLLSEWNKSGNLPPLMSDAKYINNYAKYLEDYKEWRGQACGSLTFPKTILGVPLPVIGGQTVLVCVNNVFESKFNSYLFNDIPLSSTEDVSGEVKIDSVSNATSVNPGGIKVTGVTFSNQTPSKLFFPHLEESNQLGSLLQDTYTPKGIDPVGSPTEIASGTTCNNVQVRSNAGDNLFASSIKGDLSYTATFTCAFQAAVKKDPTTQCAKDTKNLGSCVKGPWSCPLSIGQSDCGTGYTCGVACYQTVQTCNKDVYVSMSTSTKIPLVDEIWSRLVAGPMAVFKRIFPKTNTEGSVGQIMDIAGSTNVTYSGNNITTTNAALKFPHIGGISEYFLKGIQTALRPKGFGETIEFAQNSITPSCTTKTLPTLPAAQGSCNLKSTTIEGHTMPPSLVNIIEAASQTYNVPPGLIVGIMYGEGLFGGSNEKDWTEANVVDWATCGKVPGCSETGDDYFMGFTESDWRDPQNAILKDLQKLDPNKKVADRCNLLDAVYGVAWNLHNNADGATKFQAPNMPDTCFGIKLSAAVPTSCTWTNEQYESAIKVSESGYTSMCFTKEGSCVTGGGAASACTNGQDSCETLYSRYSNTSHNGCIWDVAHSH